MTDTLFHYSLVKFYDHGISTMLLEITSFQEVTRLGQTFHIFTSKIVLITYGEHNFSRLIDRRSPDEYCICRQAIRSHHHFHTRKDHPLISRTNSLILKPRYIALSFYCSLKTRVFLGFFKTSLEYRSLTQVSDRPILFSGHNSLQYFVGHHACFKNSIKSSLAILQG